MKAKAIGIRLGNSQWYQAEVRRAGDSVEIVRLSRRELPTTGPEAKEAAADQLATPNSAAVIASLSSAEVISRRFVLPAGDETRVRSMVAHRLEADLPVPIEELTWEFRQLGQGTDAGERAPGTEILVQAARTERVAQHAAALASAGCEATIVTTEAESLSALYRYGLDRGAAAVDALVLATPAEWLVAVLAEGRVRSFRRIRVPGLDKVEAACRECQQSLAGGTGTGDVQRVLWCGTNEMEAARYALGAMLHLPVEPARPAPGLVMADGQDLSLPQLAEFGPAIGLGLAGLLEPESLLRLAGRKEPEAAGRNRIERILARPAWWAGAATALLVLAATIHIGAIWWEVRTLQKLADSAQEARLARAALEPKVRALKRLDAYRLDVEKLIGAISRRMPDGVILTSLVLSRDRDVTLKGTAQPPNLVYTLAESLRKSPLFREVSPGRTEPGAGGAFTLTAELAGVRRLTVQRVRSGL